MYLFLCPSVFLCMYISIEGLPGGLVVKNLPGEDDSSVSGLRRSPGEENATHSSILALEIKGQRSLTNYSPWDHKESDTT